MADLTLHLFLTKGTCFWGCMKPWSQLAHSCQSLSTFCSMEEVGVFLPPLNGKLVHRRSLPHNLLGFPQQFASTHLYSWVERGTARVLVSCPRTQHSVPSQGLNLDSCALGTSTLTMRPSCLPLLQSMVNMFSQVSQASLVSWSDKNFIPLGGCCSLFNAG